MKGESELSRKLELLFQTEVPEFYKILDKESFASARVNRRTTWLKVSGDGGEKVSYSTGDGEIALIGDACHAMTPSMGEGCTIVSSRAGEIVNEVSLAMKHGIGLDGLGRNIHSYPTLGEAVMGCGLQFINSRWATM